ncbi:MAG: hypothetical protein P1Q69_13625, partial [Candidatus Thorarchaeota archaeon]|nr:hypothetical protein [Candidatus Thorarchaeota archaeon]
STDDVNDIAWFLVAVWAMVSTLLALTWEIFFPVCLVSAGFLIFVCFVSYYEGHKGLVNGYFEDEVDHLEYHIQSRLESMIALHSSVRSFVSWKAKNRKIVLNDICVLFEIENTPNTNISYYVGVPSEDKERIIIKCESTITETIKRDTLELISEDSIWKFSQTDDNTIEIENIKDIFDLSKRGAFVRSPEKPLYLIDLVKSLLEIIQS